MPTTLRLSLFVWIACVAMLATASTTLANNPVLPGHFADPSIVIHQGRLYVYVTRDPWGGESLACFSTNDLKTWQEHPLNWPTLDQCQTDNSTSAKVWAPSVVKQREDRFVMYVSVGSEIYCGQAANPAGPWKNVKADATPVIVNQGRAHAHMIDAELFQDDDRRNYLYWGSGWDWKNGRCLAVEVEDDFYTQIGEPQDITPPSYFEAPYMLKRNGRYYLMYSDGKCTTHTYKVRYAVADSPFGPFETEGPNSPILSTHHDLGVVGPGHHGMFSLAGQDYIAYHRIKLPQAKDLLREICFDKLNWGEDGEILPVLPTNEGILLTPRDLQ